MPKLKIDDWEIEVPAGTKVIEAADRLGIVIPRFCYHPALGSVGACRMCAVMFGDGPVKGVQMSCMVEAHDGMVVSTQHPEAVAFRKQVIEWIMMNHPHDCPVCDEGGQCLLQDMTVSGSHGIRRYLGKKRTHRDQYLGPLVQHEMNRCIHCYRCSRFYQEFAGYRDLGPMQIAHHTYFGRYKDGPLESPFSGNLVDVCPTGVYTDKPARFKGRRWDFERGPSLCIHCSLGCCAVASARYREVVLMEAEFSGSVNGYFICDRGRFGFGYANHPQRPRQARIGKGEVSWKEALKMAADTLARIEQDHGPGSIASLGSSRSNLENQAMLKRLCHAQRWREPVFFETSSMDRRIKKAVSRLDSQIAVSLRGIEHADFILVVGADPVNEAPMLALAMRQAYRRGAAVTVLDPRPVFLPFGFEHLPVGPADINRYSATLVRRAFDRAGIAHLREEAQFYDGLPAEYPEGLFKDQLAGIEQKLQQSRKPVLVCGMEVVPESAPSLAADQALLLKAAKGWAGLFYVLLGANAFGAALLSPEEGSLEQVVEEIERGKVRALLVVENDLLRLFPDQKKLGEILAKLDFLLVLDYIPSRAVERAHVFLPTATLFETESSFVNQEGRLQFAAPLYPGGIPIEQISGGGHPPRCFQPDIPGGKPKPAWSALAELANALSGKKKTPVEVSREGLWKWIREGYPLLAQVQPYESSEGIRLIPEKNDRGFAPLEGEKYPFEPQEDILQLFCVDWTFGTEELSSYSRAIQQMEEPPCLFMQAQDASRLSLADKDKVRILLDGGSLDIDLRVVKNMARGILILPRHRQLDWQKLKTVPERVPVERVKRI